MRVGVDARVLVHQPTGVARYLSGILAELPADRFAGLSLFVDRRPPVGSALANGGPLKHLADAVEIARWPLPGGDPAWRQLRLPASLVWRELDVLLCPFYSVPLATGVPRVVTVHDVSFAVHPEWYSMRARAAFSFARRSARAASRVLTVSRFSKNEIVRELEVEPGKIDVVPPGIDPRWLEPVSRRERDRARDWLELEGRFLLHLGAVHRRRNVDLAFEALASIARHHPDLSLVVAGPGYESIRTPPASGLPIVRRPWAPEEHLRGLIAEASAMMYLSSYEGFGLPALEALAVGTPVVALRRASLPEVLGDAACWVDDAEPGAVAEATSGLLSLLAEPGRAESWSTHGMKRARKFDRYESMERTWRVLAEAAAGKRR